MRRMLALLILGLAWATVANAEEPTGDRFAPRWWKGNLHTHSLWSDGNDFPEMIADWYVKRDYNFLALTDHNVLSAGVRWMKHSDIVKRGGTNALAKYRKRFGNNWVETRGEPTDAGFAVRLKPLNEFRALVEKRNEFIMIQAEEISDRSMGKPVHMNAANLRDVIPPVGGSTVREAMANNLRAVEEQSKRIGRPIMLHLNHPNFGLAVTAEDMAAVVQERFFEVYNGHPGVKQLGDDGYPTIERMWDIANTLRVGQLAAPPLFGLGTDDSHKYHGKTGSRPGRGWVMVRSRFLTPEHLLRAMEEGDFYSSSGVTLKDVQYDAKARSLRVQIQAEKGVTYQTKFVGTLLNYDAKSTPRKTKDGKPTPARKYSAEVGRVLMTSKSLDSTYKLTGRELYVRAVVTSSKMHPNPSIPKQQEAAWTQPVGWEKHVK